MVTGRAWWVGVTAIVLAILAHAAFPRYERHHAQGVVWVRSDRWTGRAEIGHFDAAHTRWTSQAELRREERSKWDLTGLEGVPKQPD